MFNSVRHSYMFLAYNLEYCKLWLPLLYGSDLLVLDAIL